MRGGYLTVFATTSSSFGTTRTAEERREMMTCPRCHSDDVLEVAYGYPSPQMAKEEAEDGTLLVGGCLISPGLFHPL
jgi:hypothetical protein